MSFYLDRDSAWAAHVAQLHKAGAVGPKVEQLHAVQRPRHRNGRNATQNLAEQVSAHHSSGIMQSQQVHAAQAAEWKGERSNAELCRHNSFSTSLGHQCKSPTASRRSGRRMERGEIQRRMEKGGRPNAELCCTQQCQHVIQPLEMQEDNGAIGPSAGEKNPSSRWQSPNRLYQGALQIISCRKIRLDITQSEESGET
jgi:hypothetical protein